MKGDGGGSGGEWWGGRGREMVRREGGREGRRREGGREA